MNQERVTPRRRKKTEDREVVEEIVVDAETDLLTDIDELLDEIDAVLEDQAVLRSFRQRSGQ